jgi:ParB/RepB/Spo0J family partition protein
MELKTILLSEIMVGDRVLPLDPSNVAHLIESIKLLGFTSAIAVRQREDFGFDLVSGCHRLHAAAALGLTEIPALVFATDTPPDLIIRNELLENLARRVLTAVEKTEHIQRLLNTTGEPGAGKLGDDTIEQLCSRMQMAPATLEHYTTAASSLTPQELATLRGTSGDTVKSLSNLADMTPEARSRRIARIQLEEERVASVQIGHLAARRTADMLSTKLRPSEITELLDQLNRTTLKQVAVQLESVLELGGHHAA